MESSQIPSWCRKWLICAGIYNLLWGAFVIIAPNALFAFAGMEPMRYPQIWQCVGMIVGVYGIGYLIASSDSRRHWPIVLVGLVGKFLGPIGFAMELDKGTFPPMFALTTITNDLIWWIPFSMILYDAAKNNRIMNTTTTMSIKDAFEKLKDQHHVSMRLLNEQTPILVVLTRHSGCTFCKEMLKDLRDQQSKVRNEGLHIVVVTMSEDAKNTTLAKDFELTSASWISDPDRIAYRALELSRGRFMQLFGPKVILRGLIATLSGSFAGKLDGDGFQMPGAFIVHNNNVIRAFRAQSASDQPDYNQLMCELPT